MSSPYNLPLIENCLICSLRDQNFFCSLGPKAMEEFNKINFSTTFPAGASLFVEGQSPRGVFLVCQGQVKLSLNSAEGKTLILKMAKPGELLGLHACVSGTAYEMSAETAQPCQVNFINRQDFLKFLNRHGDACMKAAEHLSHTCHDAVELIRTLGLSHSAGERLARLLLEMSAGAKPDKNSGSRVKVALSHEEIAQIIGTSRETVTRLLSEFRKKKLAELKGSTLHIHDRAGLERLVGA